MARQQKIASVDRVRNEIYRNEDELKLWCKDNLPSAFFEDTSNLINEYRKVCNWVQSKSSQYLPKALDEFLDANEADAWLVAFALAKHVTIVTQEVSAPGSKSKIKIPDVCISLNVRYINTIQMFRELREGF